MMVYFQPATLLATEMTTEVVRASTFSQVWANIGGATAVVGVFVALFFSKLDSSKMDPHGPANQFVFRLRPNGADAALHLREKALADIQTELGGKTTTTDGNAEAPVALEIEKPEV